MSRCRLVLRARYVKHTKSPVLKKVTQVSSEATSGFAAGEANDGDASLRIAKTNKGASLKANTFQVSESLPAKKERCNSVQRICRFLNQ